MIRKAHGLEILFSVLIGVLGLVVSVWGQGQTTGAIRGRVVDDSNTPIPGVTIHLSSPMLRETKMLFSESDGWFEARALPAGLYSLEATLPGFATSRLQGQLVQPGKVLEIQLLLKLDGVMSEIVVSAEAPMISTGAPMKVSRIRPIPAVLVGVEGTVGLPVPGELVEAAGQQAEKDEDQPSSVQEASVQENPILEVRQFPVSTFGVDVDTASYAIVRSEIREEKELPPPEWIRLEELVNYFPYPDPLPSTGEPFSVNTEIAQAPWNLEHRLLRIGLKGREIPQEKRPPSNLVFLIDVSGSMEEASKLPLLQQALKTLVVALAPTDRVAIVVYAGASGLVLPSTDRKPAIFEALNALSAGGSTNGGEGLKLAYQVALDNRIPDGNNRVILATDGDFNVGLTGDEELTQFIQEKAKSGIFLSVLGFGSGDRDGTMEKLADRGNGNFAFIDNLGEARKVLVRQLGGTLFTIARDVKIQVEFNPARVAAYRLLGYENRMLETEDFEDDSKDAGEIGSGHSVTALYELIPTGSASETATPQPLKYQSLPTLTQAASLDEILTLRLRYQEPQGSPSRLLEKVVRDEGRKLSEASVDFKFAAAVAGFGLLLLQSEYKGSISFNHVLELGQQGLGTDEEGWRKDFLQLVREAKQLSETPVQSEEP